ncbi:RHS repeat-associated core domain-containing protein [Halothiobacillus neapolitanus]|uniref:YD repeat protein n=1 Tax=Halothiobacillus neapolitanus (strain ATCC 23641 / DSM 15147 / CIP 104769 / NCIMB 8539 / c2) TaxID=555778 RepID=D0KW21_HALNC|nr:RHS repeat-associated core domain-containing protein [Halothiobacillus neapolitanus]ACX96924.1 YD repeat protein [Halothiobacillus neapolitanus c2]TDN64961.1 RHS repeat-associated protein [Halothiobacillus neapolitanus]
MNGFNRRFLAACTAALIAMGWSGLSHATHVSALTAPIAWTKGQQVLPTRDFGVFQTPLVPFGASSAAETHDLRVAIASYRAAADAANTKALDHFLHQYPNSVWRIALLTNEGLAYEQAGLFSQAITRLDAAWQLRAGAKTEPQRALIEQNYGALLHLHTVFGHEKAVQVLLQEGKGLVLSGAAQANKTQAEEGLWRMQHEPGKARLCGLVALDQLLAIEGHDQSVGRFKRVRAGEAGLSLARLDTLANQAGLPSRVVYRHGEEPIPVPAIAHWKVGHYATIVGEAGGRYHIKDAAQGRDYWMTPEAVRAESSGYFLIPTKASAQPQANQPILAQTMGSPWRRVALSEAGRIFGAGITPGNNPDDTSNDDPDVAGCGACGSSGMAQYSVKAMLVSLSLHDTPVGYAPPKGPAVPFTIVYSQREANQPANFTFGNLGQKWISNWFAYVQDDPTSPGNSVTIALRGGGTRHYAGFNATTGAFSPEERTAAQLVKVSDSPVTYERRMPDGSKEVYGASDNSTYFPRRIFLTQVVDPAGNAVTLDYDSQMRLTTLTDALGQKTTLTYSNAQYPLQVTEITDPFGRAASIAYDSSGRLIDITDVLGMHSQFTYDGGTFITAMTTPYGTTQFASGDSGTTRWLEITDPQGRKERVEFRHNAPGIPFSDSPVPQGINTFNAYINSRDTFFWDKTAMEHAPGDYTQAHIYHWLHNAAQPYYGLTAGVLESVKSPLEHRIWFSYPNQSPGVTGGFDKPSAIARVLADGSTQLTRISYNPKGNVTQTVDPLGRTVNLIYATNGVDVVEVTRNTLAGADILARLTYNAQHEPLTYTDAAGQTTTYAYNGAGQRTSMTDPLGQVTTYVYDANGYLQKVVNADGKTRNSYTYDGFGRVASSTDSEGHTLRYSYDALNRLTTVTYPDGTSRTVTWGKLDPVATTDREGRTTTYAYDSVRDLISKTDPMNQVTQYGYYANGKLESLTDPNGNTSTWARDIEGRVTGKTYPDGSQTGYTYDITGRVIERSDALGQNTAYSYALDDRLIGISYSNALQPTAAVQLGYDASYPRLTTRTDGQGTTTYGYYPAGVLGAGQLASEQGQNSHDSLQYTYNALGLLASQTVDGATERYQYDALSRQTGDSNALGDFTTAYLGETSQPVSQTISRNGQPVPYQIQYQYENNQSDRRLKAILNDIINQGRLQPVAGFTFTTSPENLILSRAENQNEDTDAHHKHDFGRHWGLPDWMFGWADRHDTDCRDHGHGFGFGHDRHGCTSDQGGQQALQYQYDDALRLIAAEDGSPRDNRGHKGGKSGSRNGNTGSNAESYQYDAASNLTDITIGKTSIALTINALNQIVTAGSTAYRYDANGNLLDDGINTYTWDAADRLVTITNQQTGHTSQFAYDGLSRRISVTETDSGGTPETTHYLWCGTRICEARDSSDTVLARYYAQGERHGSTIAYYAQDQVGSVVATVDPQGQITSRLKYDSYGNIIQSSGTLPDYRYAELYAHPQSSLYLATYRAYDPKIGRWLSRDPIRETGGINLYAYVTSNPVINIDPKGLDIWIEGPSGPEPSFHQSVNVGNMNGYYDSYSFGMDGQGIEGKVYRDHDPGGQIENYKRTTSEQDRIFKSEMDKKLGNTGIYGWDDICRSWSQRQFKNAPGIPSQSPVRKVSPHWNVSPSSSRSTTGPSSSSGTWTSK